MNFEDRTPPPAVINRWFVVIRGMVYACYPTKIMLGIGLGACRGKAIVRGVPHRYDAMVRIDANNYASMGEYPTLEQAMDALVTACRLGMDTAPLPKGIKEETS